MNRHASRIGAGSVATAAGLLFALTACTSGTEPTVTETPSPPVSASPSASASASPTPLTDEELLALLPEEAAYPDIRGAIATAVFFVEQFSVVYETGDLRLWDALSMPECIFCESVRSAVLAEKAIGDFETGGELTVDTNSIVANYYEVDGYWYVTFDYSQDAMTIHHADGSSELSSDAESGSISLRMTSSDGLWMVAGVEAIAD